MTTYELTYIITPEVTSQEAESKAKEIETIIQSKEGVILRQANPNARALAYPIKKSASGFMGVIEFQIEPENLDTLKTETAKDGKVIRQMLVTKKPIKAAKARRTRPKPEETFKLERKQEDPTGQKQEKEAATKDKVELKDIEQTLDELLGE